MYAVTNAPRSQLFEEFDTRLLRGFRTAELLDSSALAGLVSC